jgi:ABC-type taurine transport system substrate-binding protein
MARGKTGAQIVPDIIATFERILGGRYETVRGDEWIVSGKRRVRLADASSGQQEVVPLILLLVWLCSGDSQVLKAPWWICVEEPESHLFPIAQRQLIELLVRIHNKCGHRFMITTHSPYVLTVLNNLVMADTVAKEKVTNRPLVNKLVAKAVHVPSSEVAAYLIDKGTARSIVDTKTGLIEADQIDAVSSDLALIFDKLMEISLGNES